MPIQRFLVVDDSRLARFSLARLLNRMGLEGNSVESGQEAIDFLKTQSVDIIFMDYRMPDMDGYQAAQAIATDPATAKIPVVMCTAMTDEDGNLQVHPTDGVYAHIPKPPDEGAVRGALEAVEAQLADLEQQAATEAAAAATAAAAMQSAADPGEAIDVDELKRELEEIARRVAEETTRRVVAELLR